MEKFMHVKPAKEHEKQAIEFIKEFYEYNSEMHGISGLDKFLDNYEGWLSKLEEDRIREPNEIKVPAETFFLVRKNDNKIVGMIDIRLALNENLKKYGGHIGYSIRPKERCKGYNKINLYLGLLFCKNYGIEKVLMFCNKDNLGSAKTMKALGGTLIKETKNSNNDKDIMQSYTIDVNESIENYKNKHEIYI